MRRTSGQSASITGESSTSAAACCEDWRTGVAVPEPGLEELMASAGTESSAVVIWAEGLNDVGGKRRCGWEQGGEGGRSTANEQLGGKTAEHGDALPPPQLADRRVFLNPPKETALSRLEQNAPRSSPSPAIEPAAVVSSPRSCLRRGGVRRVKGERSSAGIDSPLKREPRAAALLSGRPADWTWSLTTPPTTAVGWLLALPSALVCVPLTTSEELIRRASCWEVGSARSSTTLPVLPTPFADHRQAHGPPAPVLPIPSKPKPLLHQLCLRR